MKKFTWAVMVLAGMAILCPGARGQETAEPAFEELGDYLEYAGMHNAELAASREAWRSAREEIAQAKVLPEPRFEYQLETQRTPHGQTFGIMQPLPWFGTIKARTETARAMEKAAARRIAAQNSRLLNDIKQAYFELGYLARQYETAIENLELAKHFEEVARIKYATAQANHPDHIRSEIEIARAQYEIERLERQRDGLVARLNAILNRPIVARLPWPKKSDANFPSLDVNEVGAAAAKGNYELSVMESEIAAARSRVELAKKRYYPEFEIGFDAMYQSEATMGPGADPVYAKVAVTLPIWASSYRAGERQARANLRQSGYRRAQAKNDITAQAQKAGYEYNDAGRRARLYRESIIPRAQEMLASYEALYRSGGADFASLIEAQRVLLNARLEYESAIAEQAQRLAEIEMLTGGTITGMGQKF